MKINSILMFLLMVLFASCGTTKDTTHIAKNDVIAPEGIEFKTVKNYKVFSRINLPVNGNGFGCLNNLDSVNDDNEVVPEVKFNRSFMSIIGKIYDTTGDLNQQYSVLKEKRLSHYIKEIEVSR